MFIGLRTGFEIDGQETAAQVKALKDAGCTVYLKRKPPVADGIDRSFIVARQLRGGDTLVVWKLDRLSRSLKDLLHIWKRSKPLVPASGR